MRIVEKFSHLNGYEYLHYHKKHLWNEIVATIRAVNAAKCKTKISKEARMKGKPLYSPRDMNAEMGKGFKSRGWQSKRRSSYVTKNQEIAKKILSHSARDQKKEIEAAGESAILSYTQTDFVKDRVAVEVQFGKYPFVSYDLFVKHMSFFVSDEIDIGIEILPMKELQSEMSSGPSYYEGEISNILRQGRGIPAVPLIIIGVAP